MKQQTTVFVGEMIYDEMSEGVKIKVKYKILVGKEFKNKNLEELT